MHIPPVFSPPLDGTRYIWHTMKARSRSTRALGGQMMALKSAQLFVLKMRKDKDFREKVR